jgi:hypothetical protein
MGTTDALNADELEALIEKASAEIDRNGTPEGRRETATEDAELYLSGLNSGFREWNVRNLAREFLSVKAGLELTESRLLETEHQRRASNGWLSFLGESILEPREPGLTSEDLVKRVIRDMTKLRSELAQKNTNLDTKPVTPPAPLEAIATLREALEGCEIRFDLHKPIREALSTIEAFCREHGR